MASAEVRVTELRIWTEASVHGHAHARMRSCMVMGLNACHSSVVFLETRHELDILKTIEDPRGARKGGD